METKFRESIDKAVHNPNLTGALGRFSEAYRISRAKAYEGYDFEALRTQIAERKSYAASHLDELADLFTQNAEARGTKVFRTNDPAKVRDIAYRVREIMRSDDRVVDANLDWNEKMPSVTLEVDQARARALGLTPQDISQTLQTLIGGVTVTTIRAGEEKVDVVARAIPEERAALDEIGSLTILAHDGAAVANVPTPSAADLDKDITVLETWRKTTDERNKVVRKRRDP